MLSDQEIRIVYHIFDCIGPGLEKKHNGRIELKPENRPNMKVM